MIMKTWLNLTHDFQKEEFFFLKIFFDVKNLLIRLEDFPLLFLDLYCAKKFESKV